MCRHRMRRQGKDLFSVHIWVIVHHEGKSSQKPTQELEAETGEMLFAALIPAPCLASFVKQPITVCQGNDYVHSRLCSSHDVCFLFP